MRTLLERLDWVLEHRGLTQLGWSKRAGLSTRYLSTLRGRLEAKPDARGDHDAMVKLATVAGVPVAWLEDGKGDPGNLEMGPELHREPLAELAPEDDESPAEAALLRVLDVARHTLADLDAARAALRSVDRATRADALPEAMAAAWLEAAAGSLRRPGRSPSRWPWAPSRSALAPSPPTRRATQRPGSSAWSLAVLRAPWGRC